MKEKRILVTGPSPWGWHRLQQVLECPSKYAWGYLDKDSEEEEKDPLVKGSLIHLGIAHFYQRRLEKQEKRDPDVFYKPKEAIRLYAEIAGGLSAKWADLACEVTDDYVKKQYHEK